MIIDLHNHTTPASDDSTIKLEDLILKAKERGIDALCLTEHDWFWDPQLLRELSEEYSLLLLPGAEISTEEGHLLVFGLESYVFGMHRAQFVRHLVDEVSGAMIVAHPYRRHFRESEEEYNYIPSLERACGNHIFRLADAAETINGRATDKENAFSLNLSQRLELKGVGGSDAHHLSDIGSCATLFQRRVSDLQELVAELKAGRFQTVDLRRRSPG